MHIVHTEASQGWGGQEIRILTESLGMLKRGHRVTLLTPESARIYGEARKLGIDVVAMPFEKTRLKGVLAVRRWLNQNTPDVINTHSSVDSWIISLAQLPGGKIPVVRTRHISPPLSKSWTTRWIYLKAVKRIVTTGEKLRLNILQRLNANPAHVISVPTGIDLNRYSRTKVSEPQTTREKASLPDNATVICIAATIRSWKGHIYLVEAFDRLARDYPDIHLLIVGEGPARPWLEERIKESPFQGRIHMTGHSEKVEDFLAASDIFALPSYANEGVPQAIMQALAMELPVVSTDVGAINEVVIDGQTGYQVPAKDARALADALEKLIVDKELRRKMGEQGRQLVAERFTDSVMVESMEKVFLEAMQADSVKS